MTNLAGKRVIITGVSNRESLAWGITEKFAEQGAEIILSYQGPSHLRRIKQLCKDIEPVAILQCDFTDALQVEQLFAQVSERWSSIDGFIHSMAFADVDCLAGNLTDCNKDDFLKSMEISVFSLVAACRFLKTSMSKGGSIQTLSYNGSQKVLPNYHVMGLAKAALESAVRYLAYELGPEGMRINAISAGPIETIASKAIPEFQEKLAASVLQTPTRKQTTKEDVAELAAFLASDSSRNINGSLYYLDGGLHTLGC